VAEARSETNVLLACVPNFSEGRRQDVIDAILRALEVSGAHVVYRQWDPEHNRLDATVIGAPDAVRLSAFAGAAKTVELIDMDEHQGSHPRMGAADVIPFMPIRGITMEECVALARDFARELAETLDLPVYCYDRAALSEERRSLAEVRKGEYEGLRDAVARGERLPDFGPHRIGRAGATAVGARKPLIAFNMYLSGSDEGASEAVSGADEAVAKEIAKAVRESSGGLPAVRAIGFAVPERGCVTVSMNLVDHEVTGLRVAFDAVSAEAAHRGMHVLDSEIVGLVPQAAIADEDVADLRLEGFDADGQILERLVSAAQTGNERIGAQSISEFLEALASERPTPGGGAVAALAGAFGAALLDMVALLTIGKKGYESAWDRMREVSVRAGEARGAFLTLADRDVVAFDQLITAFRLPKDTEEQKADRSRAIQAAYLAAAEVPLEVARAAAGLMEFAPETVELGNANAASDAASAGHQLFAASKCAIHNVEINVAGLKDADRAAALRAEIRALRARAEELLEATDRAFAARVT